MSQPRTPSLVSATLPVCQMLEGRTLLCDAHMLALLPEAPQWSDKRETAARAAARPGGGTIIDWTNRGLANDNFATTFGNSAETMRNIVDAALFSWQRVITDWNRSDGSVSLQVTISVQAPGTNFGGAAAPAATAPADGKPRTGSVSLGGGFNTPDPNDVNGWFADPDPYDNAEFLGPIINAYTSEAAGGGLDFFSLVSIEMAHVLGIISDGNNDGGAWQGYRLENFVTNTGVPDIAQGGGNGTYRVFNGSTINHVMTSFNSGTAGVNSWGNVIHTAGPTANVTFGPNYRGSVDPGNALYGPQRYLPSFVAAHILADAYGYSIAEPMTFGTFHAVIDDTTGRLTVRGGGGVSDDNINISFINGNTIRVSVDVGSDVPGTGALPGVGNLPAFVTDFPAISVSEIFVDAGEGDDLITIHSLPFFADATLRGGLGNDFIQFAPGAANLDSVDAPITVDGGSGASDIVRFHDFNSPGSHNYEITATGMTRVGSGGWTLSNVETREIYGADGNNDFNIAATPAGTLWRLAGHLGNDDFNVGTFLANAEGIDGAIELFGEEGSDKILYFDSTAFGLANYTFESNQILRTNNAAVTYATVETIDLYASDQNNIITLGTPPTALIPALFITGEFGDDTVQVSLSDTNGGFGGTFWGSDGTDTLVVNDTRSTVSVEIYNSGFLGGTIRQHNYDFDAMIYNGAGGNDNFGIYSTAAATTYTFNGIGGNDAFVLAHTLGNQLDDIDGLVTINGGDGTDTVRFDDFQEPTARSYSFHSNLVTSGGTMADVSYGTVEGVSFLGGGGNDDVTVRSTSAAAPMTLSGGLGVDRVDVLDNAPGSPVNIDGHSPFFGFENVNVNTDGAGVASIVFDFTALLNELNVFNGGTATLLAGSPKVIDTDALTLAATGKLDLNDNDLIVDYTGASTRAAVQALINSGRAGGAWTGNGITSTAAKNANPRNTTLGVLEATEFKAIYGGVATFAGRSIDTTAVLVKYTYYGDADFSGVVNFDDYTRTDGGFLNGRTGWLNGDFDGNGLVNFDDYALIDLAFNTQVATL